MTQGLSSSSASPRSDLQAVWSAFGQGCRRLMLHPQAPWRMDSNRQLRAEREKILLHLQPAAMGLFVTAFCFATFACRVVGGGNKRGKCIFTTPAATLRQAVQQRRRHRVNIFWRGKRKINKKEFAN